MKKTKIITSLGPSSYNGDTFTQMVLNGANVARINFSHVTPEEKIMDLDAVHEARKRTGQNIAILYDTKGPEFRNGVFEGDEVTLIEGNTIRIVKEDVIGNSERFTVNHPKAIDSLEVGNEVLLENGLMKLEVISKEDDGVTCKIINGGILGNKKSMSVPGVKLDIPFISEQDREDIIYACEHEGDYLALSFVGSKEDVLEAREILKKCNREDLKIISKIESVTGINNLEEIIEVSDGVMVARGDLGVEVPMSKLPIYQKEIIRCARKHGKIAVVATEMLESMKKNARPTRAEVSDVTAAVFDGTDAVMLSGETTIGKHPVETVAAMARTCAASEKYTDFTGKFELPDNDDNDCVALASGVINCANIMDAKLIVVQSHTGKTAQILSNLKPNAPILAITDDEKLGRRIGLNYGVYSIVSERSSSIDKFIVEAKKCALEFAKNNDFELKSGDKILITAGFVGSDENSRKYADSNLMKIDTI